MAQCENQIEGRKPLRLGQRLGKAQPCLVDIAEVEPEMLCFCSLSTKAVQKEYTIVSIR
jgi:hypothetical protein